MLKLGPLEWALIQSDLCPHKRRKFEHTKRKPEMQKTKKRPREDTTRRKTAGN